MSGFEWSLVVCLVCIFCLGLFIGILKLVDMIEDPSPKKTSSDNEYTDEMKQLLSFDKVIARLEATKAELHPVVFFHGGSCPYETINEVIRIFKSQKHSLMDHMSKLRQEYEFHENVAKNIVQYREYMDRNGCNDKR